MALKRPHAISFSKKNLVRPFEDTSPLSFWAQKNDASLFVVGQTTKKGPDGLVFARMVDGQVLDMCEVGVDGFVSMDEFKVSTPPINTCHLSSPITYLESIFFPKFDTRT